MLKHLDMKIWFLSFATTYSERNKGQQNNKYLEK